MRANTSSPPRRRALALTLLLLAGWPLAAWAAALALAVEPEPGRGDALAVLAGSSAYEERAALAAELYRAGHAPVVLLTDDGQRGGWSSEEGRNPFFVERAAAELRSRGVPPGAIRFVPGVVSGTHEEAGRLRAYAEGHGLRSLVVVTSAYQARRARRTFAKVFEGGGVALTFAAAPPGAQTPGPAAWWLSARGWRMVAGEYVKTVYYLARYG